MSNESLGSKKNAELRKMAIDLEIEGAEDMEREDLIVALTPTGETLSTPDAESGEDDDKDEKEEKNILDDMTIKELKAEAETRGVEVDNLKLRPDILAALEKAEEESGSDNNEPPAKPSNERGPSDEPESDDSSKSPESLEPTPIPEEGGIVTGITGASVSAGSKAAIMKKKLAAQPKVRILVSLEGGEKFGITKSVILNGYRMNIIKGIYVDVPEQVADVLSESQQQALEALDGPRRIDGTPMRIEGDAPGALQ